MYFLDFVIRSCQVNIHVKLTIFSVQRLPLREELWFFADFSSDTFEKAHGMNPIVVIL